MQRRKFLALAGAAAIAPALPAPALEWTDVWLGESMWAPEVAFDYATGLPLYSTAIGAYKKFGKLVSFSATITVPSRATGATMTLPFIDAE